MSAGSRAGGPFKRWVYRFGGGTADGSAGMTERLGRKGANLAEMANLGLPVPPGFTISTQACNFYHANGRQLPADLQGEVTAALAEVALAMGAEFGDAANPLLLSIRPGAPVAMPGMTDTILNLGLNDAAVEGLAAVTGLKALAYDSYRRFIQAYGNVVLGIDHGVFDDLLDQNGSSDSPASTGTLPVEDLQALAKTYQQAVAARTGTPFPQDVGAQLWGAVRAVFDSWLSTRAVTYRTLNDFPDHWGMAVNIQAMVTGNRGGACHTGIATTRNAMTGERQLHGHYRIGAGDGPAPAGAPARRSLTESSPLAAGQAGLSLQAAMPAVFTELAGYCDRIEKHYRDMQEIEFAIEGGQLWMLQTRAGKSGAAAALKIAVDLAAEGVVGKDEALLRIEASQLERLLHPAIDPEASKLVIATGLSASPGAACGVIAFTADAAETVRAQGGQAVLVRTELGPNDIRGLFAAAGILTTRGGLTGHAEMVARGMGRPFVSAAGTLRLDQANGLMSAAGHTLRQGDLITIDGTSGQVMKGRVAMRQPELSGDFATLMSWADSVRRLKVRANAETPRDARQARAFGAEGIGLCRTEHMFFEEGRILAVREMILADSPAERQAALAKILPMQRQDFIELFEIMTGYPVTVRLLDPPLHEFLPHEAGEIEAVAAALGMAPDRLRRRLAQLREQNPMLGFRGCRLGLVYPEITQMQARGIFEAAIAAANTTGVPVQLEIMVPLVAFAKELENIKAIIDGVAAAVANETGAMPAYAIGTMIELPRAALAAGEIARHAEFFSFGSNDLTQTALGLSRDDAAPILAAYRSLGIVGTDPFVSLDADGVGELIRMAVARGREARPELKLGICGEHGGDPLSIAFCEATRLDYVSCSPFRVPIARLAAAQAVLTQRARQR